jgi:apolipoprotein N-acyltransferase
MDFAIKNKNWSLLGLLLGTILLMFSNGRLSVPTATWLFSVFFIRFFRGERTFAGLTAGGALFVSAYIFISWQILSLEALQPVFRLGSGMALGLLFLLPFLIDRFLSPRLRGYIATFVFPCIWVTIEYLISLVNGSWFSLAYTQYGNLPLMQAVSITGIWGISFLLTWFASVANHLWENEFNCSKSKGLVCLYCAAFAAVLLYGGAKLTFFYPFSTTIKVASVLSTNKNFVDWLFQPGFKERKSIRKQSITEQDYFLERSRAAARQGAKVVVWQEYAVSLLKEDETTFIQLGTELARQEAIYLVMVFAVLPQNFPRQPWENKLVWINPDGNVMQEYKKSKPAPPLEPILPGDGIVPVVNTPFGKIASVICADQNYPSLVRQAGRAGAGLLLVPSLDWKAVSPLHTQMGIFRAIENGCAMIKTTGEGLSAAVDCQGRVLSALDFWNTEERVMYSHVPIESSATIYQFIGDSFAWFCILGCVVLTGFAFYRCRRVDDDRGINPILIKRRK